MNKDKLSKTKRMHFGSKQRTKHVSLNIKYRQQTLSLTSSYRYLGIKLDQSLSLTEYFVTTYKKASGRLYLLKRIRSHLTKQAVLAIYRTMIVPLFTYCSILTLNVNQTQRKRKISFERRTNELIFGSNISVRVPKIENLANC